LSCIVPPMGLRTLRLRTIVIQIVALAVSILLGGLLIAKRVGADAPAPKGNGGGAAQAVDAPDASEKADKADKADKGDKGDKSEKSDKPPEDQMEDTVVGPDGGVPIHQQGPYRSPFANPKWGKVADVRVGMVINDITNYDIHTGSYVADFYLSLTSEKEMPSMDLMFPNGKPDEKQVIADKPTFKLYRFTGTFTTPPDLRKYPFDEQQLTIQVEENTEGIDQIRLIPDQAHTHLEAGFEVIGWDVTHIEAVSVVHNFPDRFDNDDLYYGRYEFRLGIDRYGTSAVFTVYVPAIIIVLISLMGIWIPFENVDVRSNAGAPMLAAAVLFHFALMQALPAVSYLTRADKLMIGVYLSLFLNMLSTWWFFVVEHDTIERVFRIARVIVPVATVIIMVVACVA
jgi:hypothetical protein